MSFYNIEDRGRLYVVPYSIELFNHNIATYHSRLKGCSVNKYCWLIGFFLSLFNVARLVTTVDKYGKVDLVYVNRKSLYKEFARLLSNPDKALNWTLVDAMTDQCAVTKPKDSLDKIKPLVDKYFDQNLADYRSIKRKLVHAEQTIHSSEVSTIEDSIHNIARDYLQVKPETIASLTDEQIEAALEECKKDKRSTFFEEHFFEILDFTKRKYGTSSDLYKRCVASWPSVKEKIQLGSNDTLLMRIKNPILNKLRSTEKELAPLSYEKFLDNPTSYKGPHCTYVGSGYHLCARFEIYYGSFTEGLDSFRVDQLQKFGKDGIPVDHLMIEKRNSKDAILNLEEAKAIAEIILNNPLRWLDFGEVKFNAASLTILGDALSKSKSLKNLSFYRCKVEENTTLDKFWAACNSLETVVFHDAPQLYQGLHECSSIIDIIQVGNPKTPLVDQIKVIENLKKLKKFRINCAVGFGDTEQTEFTKLIKTLENSPYIIHVGLDTAQLSAKAEEALLAYLKDNKTLKKLSIRPGETPVNLTQIWKALEARDQMLDELNLEAININNMFGEEFEAFCKMLNTVKAKSIKIGKYDDVLKKDRISQVLENNKSIINK